MAASPRPGDNHLGPASSPPAGPYTAVPVPPLPDGTGFSLSRAARAGGAGGGGPRTPAPSGGVGTPSGKGAFRRVDPPLPSPYAALPDAPPPAEWWERLAARIIDAAGFVALYWILSLSFYSLLAPAGEGRGADPRVLPGLFAGLIAFGGYTLYDYVLHARDGRTIGKKVMGIRLVPYGGAGPDRAGLVRRAALYPGVLLTAGIPAVNLLAAVLGFAGALFILMDKPLQRGPHDRLAGTVVVKDLR
ncbi:RDD family protein [Planomonospora parontospora]|uniref:RDD family protein n=1 Tax=Planomonospora parontospora TaxID=58119 RepID=UPI0019A9556C|nr:RDD family protein [Planomonospora parontospora]GGL28446.1 hypothetical protein GCM10014719_32420 [Planomonospora parontospora subsp. antibiotica]GII18041.1 hypothetical protein Ppa05_47670 [Planomonospora parontospora subsp. antibiotica]